MIIGNHEEFIGTKKQSVISAVDFVCFVHFVSEIRADSSAAVLTFKPSSKIQAQAP